MRRVFYYSSTGIKVFEWKGDELLGSLKFKNNEAGYDDFEEYLKSSPDKPSQLLVDIIEEDFRRESIPHVNARDRKALINRLLDRHYRDEAHHQVRLLERSKAGRKDDHILLSALSNFEQIDPWITRINRQNVPLAGIWSVPLLTEELMKARKVRDENVLLVTRELPWSQRETFFRNGRLVFSRLEKIEHDLYRNPDAQHSLKCLQQGSEQIRHFLTNQRIVGFVEPIKVICLVPSTHVNVCVNKSIDTPQISYELVSSRDILEENKVLGCDQEADDVIFAWLCTQKNLFNDHYGTHKQKANFYHFAIEKCVDIASTLGALILVTAAALLWLDGTEIDQKILAENTSTSVLQRRYEKEFGEIGPQLEDAYIIQSTVAQSKILEKETSETLQKYFPELATVYSQWIFSPVVLEEMYWSKHPRENIPQIVRELSGRTQADELEESGDIGYIDDGSEAEATLKMQPVIRLLGTLQRDNLSYRQTVMVMREFVNTMQNLSMVSELHLVKTPVDIRPEARFSDKGGMEQDNHEKLDSADKYELLLVIKPVVIESMGDESVVAAQ